MNTPAVQKKRFQGWMMTPRGRIEGIWPIPAGQTPEEYVDLQMDAAGQVTAVEERIAGCAELLTRRPTWSGGRVAHSDFRDPSTGLQGRNIYEFDARGLMCARQEVDALGKLRFRIEVQCDDQGRFVEERILDLLKRPLERHVYELDAQGRMVKDRKYGKDGTTLLGFHALRYDDKGRIARRSWHDGKGVELNAFSYVYDAMDRRVEMTIEQGGKRRVTSRYTFDGTGATTKTDYLDGAGKPLDVKLPPGTDVALPDADRVVMDGAQRLADMAGVDPRNLKALVYVAYAHFENGRFEDARSLFESLAALDPHEPYHHAGVAAAALQQGEAQTALNWYERALTQNPKHLPSLVGKGEALIKLGRVEDALRTLKSAVKDNPAPDDPAVRRIRAIVTALTQPGGKVPAPIAVPLGRPPGGVKPTFPRKA